VEREKKKAAAKGRIKKLAEDERKKGKELHFIKCPKCGMTRIEIDSKGIKVDRCSSCEGAWLDQGELETVIDTDKSGLEKLFTRQSKVLIDHAARCIGSAVR
jgi:Zn-finger nucleic acid-binding protein